MPEDLVTGYFVFSVLLLTVALGSLSSRPSGISKRLREFPTMYLGTEFMERVSRTRGHTGAAHSIRSTDDGLQMDQGVEHRPSKPEHRLCLIPRTQQQKSRSTDASAVQSP